MLFSRTCTCGYVHVICFGKCVDYCTVYSPKINYLFCVVSKYTAYLFVIKLFLQMVASTEPSSPKVPLLAKFGKPRALLINSVSCSSV